MEYACFAFDAVNIWPNATLKRYDEGRRYDQFLLHGLWLALPFVTTA